MRAVAARSANAAEQSLAPRARVCRRGAGWTPDRAALGRAGRAGLATWQLQVERLRRALGGRFSILARSSRGLHRAFATASRPRCQLRGSRRARLDVEVLCRPKWRWRPAHSDAASNFHQASSCMSTDLGETHRTCAGSEASRRPNARLDPAHTRQRTRARAHSVGSTFRSSASEERLGPPYTRIPRASADGPYRRPVRSGLSIPAYSY